MRLSHHCMFMEVARIIAKRGTCPRLCVGAVIVAGNRIVSIGYNGAPSGEPHCTDIGCLIKDGRCVRTVHAEDNAIRNIPSGMKALVKSLYVTTSPCSNCADKIIGSDRGILSVYYDTPYRDTEPLVRLINHGVRVFRVLPNGYMINASTGDIIEAE